MHGHASTELEGRRVVVVCECGNRYDAPNEDTALKRLEIHQKIHEARAALEGNQEDQSE